MRYYEEKYPDVDDLVMAQVRSIAEMGAYVKLVSFGFDLAPDMKVSLAHSHVCS